MRLVVSKSDEFFITIAKHEYHSFILAGVRKRNGQIHSLTKVGKRLNFHEDNCFGLLKAGLYRASALLWDEGVHRRSGSNIPISYTSYSITYEQYLDLVFLLEKAQQEFRCTFDCYKPISATDENVVLEYTFDWKLIPNLGLPISNQEKNETEVVGERPVVQQTLHRTHVLAASNTCRHTAIDLIHYVTGVKESTQNLSSQFFRDLPLKTSLVADQGEEFMFKGEAYRSLRPDPNKYFYILPKPPTAFKELDGFKRKVLTDLYSRMERMLSIAPNSKETQEKFELLKTLYNQHISDNSESIDQFLTSLQQWKNEHQKEIGKLRKTFFFDHLFQRQSATAKLFQQWLQEGAKHLTSFNH